jgi:hypothetical protein
LFIFSFDFVCYYPSFAYFLSSSTVKIQNLRHLPVGTQLDDVSFYGGPRFDDLEEVRGLIVCAVVINGLL